MRRLRCKTVYASFKLQYTVYVSLKPKTASNCSIKCQFVPRYGFKTQFTHRLRLVNKGFKISQDWRTNTALRYLWHPAHNILKFISYWNPSWAGGRAAPVPQIQEDDCEPGLRMINTVFASLRLENTVCVWLRLQMAVDASLSLQNTVYPSLKLKTV